MKRVFARHTVWGLLVASSLVWAQGRPTPGANTDLPPPAGDDFTNPDDVVPFPDANEDMSNGDSNNSASRPRANIQPPAQRGGGSGANNPPSAGVANAAANLKLGDYVELDDSIRNEMWGTINFPNAELKEIVTSISKLAGKNFILDKKLEGKRISIVSQKPVSNKEAYNAFLSALYANDLTVVSLGSFLKIIETKNALQSNIRVFVGDYAPASEEIITLLYPLNFLNAEEIQRFLIDLVPRNGRITAYPNTNTLVMTDTGLNLRRIISILKSIDVTGHEDRLENIPIRYASAKGIAQMIDDILDNTGGGSRRSSGANRGPQKTRGGGIISKIVPDERTNSLVVLANGRGVKELRDLVSKLDTPGASGSGNIHIYYCKNAVAEELAATINALISGQKQPATGANPNPNASVFPPSTGSLAQRRTTTGGDGVALEGNIRVTADKATNSLVIVGSGADYASLKNVLDRLDIPRRQVYVEATIMEVNSTTAEELGFGVNVAAPGVAQVAGFNTTQPKVNFLNAISTPASLGGLVAGFKAGGAQSFDIPGVGVRTISTVTGLIQAIQTSKQGQILHQPQILTSDNTDSEIKVVDKIPVKASTQTAQTNGSPLVTETFQKEDVTISLKLTPQIGEDSDLIKLKIEQAIDDFTASTFEGQIEVTQRKANTTVSVRNGDTVVVGGLQKTVSSDTRSKLPLLGDLPVIGWLFKGKKAEMKKTNLIIFMTPHIIQEYGDILKITGEKIDIRREMGRKLYDPKDVQIKDLENFKAKNDADKKKPAPKAWGRGKNFSEEQDFLVPKEETGEWRADKGDMPNDAPVAPEAPPAPAPPPVPAPAPAMPDNTTVITTPPSG